MEKILAGLLVLLLVFSLASCGAKEKVAEKVAEKAAEKILKGAGVDADIDGDKMVIKGEDGQKVTIGGDKWPSSDLAKIIPEFRAGKIVSVMEAEDSLFIMIEKISGEDFTVYLNEVKKVFTKETFEINTGTGMVYSAGNDEGIGVMLTYEKDVGFSIAVSQAEPKED